MRKFFILLSILFVTGILWLRSGFWGFEADEYVNQDLWEKSRGADVELDLEFLKAEFSPAYEY